MAYVLITRATRVLILSYALMRDGAASGRAGSSARRSAPAGTAEGAPARARTGARRRLVASASAPPGSRQGRRTRRPVQKTHPPSKLDRRVHINLTCCPRSHTEERSVPAQGNHHPRQDRRRRPSSSRPSATDSTRSASR